MRTSPHRTHTARTPRPHADGARASAAGQAGAARGRLRRVQQAHHPDRLRRTLRTLLPGRLRRLLPRQPDRDTHRRVQAAHEHAAGARTATDRVHARTATDRAHSIPPCAQYPHTTPHHRKHGHTQKRVSRSGPFRRSALTS
eukprot:2953892-Prymnesium_polylepis.1